MTKNSSFHGSSRELPWYLGRMEGPSLVIACEEFAPFNGKKPKKVSGTAKLPMKELKAQKFIGAKSWGKHFLLFFEKMTLRVHFLMFGSYRIDDPRENRIPKLTLEFANGEVNFYSCAIRVLEGDPDEIYDWSIDTMSSKWNSAKALKKIQSRPAEMVCDVLMNQDIFAGVGNIIKNEVLFLQKLHPETLVGALTPERQKALVRETRAYCLQFYKWKKANVLKRNWKIFRKKVCPVSETPVTKEKTGKLDRFSHWCEDCQPMRVAAARKAPKTRAKFVETMT